MKRHAVAAIAAALVLWTGAASAQQPFDEKLQATTYKAKLVQALDECAVPTTVLSGLAACAPANTNTDGARFSVGSVAVKAKNISSQVLTILKSSGNAADKKDLGGLQVHTRLVVRVTRRDNTNPATYSDLVLDCDNPSPVTVSGTGNYVDKRELVTGCGLPIPLASEQYLKEIVSASVVNSGTGLPLAVPGVRKK